MTPDQLDTTASAVVTAALVALRGRAAGRIPTSDLLVILNDHESPAWPQPLTDRRLSRLLRRVGCRPSDSRFPSGRVLKGYRVADLERAAERLTAAPANDGEPVCGDAAAPVAWPRNLDELLAYAVGQGIGEQARAAVHGIYWRLVELLEEGKRWAGRLPLGSDAAKQRALGILAQPRALVLVATRAQNLTDEALRAIAEHLIDLGYNSSDDE